MEKNTALEALHINYAAQLRAQVATEKAVHAARAAGASWADVAARLNITRQAAQQKYSKSSPELIAADRLEDRAVLASYAANKATTDHAAHVEATAIFLDGQAPAKAEKPRQRKPNATQTQRGYTDDRPSFTLQNAGRINGTAQPGTGKGPHACPRCGSTNHKGADNQVRAYFDCTPTKYDPKDIADYLNSTGLSRKA